MITKEHLNSNDSEKYATNYLSHLKSLDATTFGSAAANADFEYVRQIKENKPYFIDSNYTNNTDNHREPPQCDSYECGNDKNNDKNGQQMHECYVNDYDDSLSMNGDNSKDLLVTSSGNGGTAIGNRSRAQADGGVKRKHFDEIIVDSDNNDIHKIYKSGCGDATPMGPNKFDYMKGFDSLRPRNFEEIQSDEHHRLMAVSSGGSGNAGGDYRVNSSDEHGSRCGDDGGANLNVSYASSDDLNQTNASEHDDKVMSGSDDEGGGEYAGSNWKKTWGWGCPGSTFPAKS